MIFHHGVSINTLCIWCLPATARPGDGFPTRSGHYWPPVPAPPLLCSPDITRCTDGCQSGNPNHYLVPATGVNTNLTKLPNEDHRLIYHQEDFQEDSKGCLGARIRRCTRTERQGKRTGEEVVRATGNLCLWRYERSVIPGHWRQVTNTQTPHRMGGGLDCIQ